MRIKNRQIKINNKWRAGFFGLLIFNGLILLILLVLIFWPVSNNEFPPNTMIDEQESSEFYIQTTKQNLNNLVNAYVEKLLEGTEHHYRIMLEDDVHLMGELPVFHPLYLYPSVSNRLNRQMEIWFCSKSRYPLDC